MDNCNLAIIDLSSSMRMTLATASIIIAILLQTIAQSTPSMKMLLSLVSLGLYTFGWLYLGYNLRQSMPENAYIFWPAIITILITSILYTVLTDSTIKYTLLGLYSAAWLALGYIITNHLTGANKYLGVLSAVIAIVSTNFITTTPGISGYTAALSIITIVYGLPTFKTVEDDLPDCLYSLFQKVPQLEPYANEIKCVMKSGCFNKVLTMPATLTTPQKLKILSDAVQCAANQCDSGMFKNMSNTFDCYVSEGCFNDIISNPPTDFNSLLAALGAIYACVNTKAKTCPEYVPKN